MTRRVSTAQAKAQFSALVAEVAFGGEQVIIERYGRPLAALVGLDDFERLAHERGTSSKPLGALALVGGWDALTNQEIDQMIEGIYAQRDKDLPGRLICRNHLSPGYGYPQQSAETGAADRLDRAARGSACGRTGNVQHHRR